MTDFGLDIAMAGLGLAYGRTAEELDLVHGWILRALSTQPGSVPGAEGEGMDLLDRLHADWDPVELSGLESEVRAVLMRDPRIEDVTVAVALPESQQGTLTVTVTGLTALGPFRLVLAPGESVLKVLEGTS